ncbi:putative mucin/carbohydrate-binding domain-containing protein [Bacillus cereus group sp. BfR-BA-01119]|uniref:putative mucin/carbohydrate-binding domain-containing protein n=1 Tax=Bacillus cereus group TaxID=86661 RepID=UPI0029C35862|nr:MULTISPECIES: putative mucin/carbohydrate-binding domain-containing protein [unclassified Bacillus cereus group]MDX5868541.1 putative mucin/carbohydrate-binding domain-containing protein [Bacillus cereus group sp. BfR-BA-01119]MDX5911157.1 putative mucin/carbohydrate-binding domain-containing protein [Bacillus cereus group sp. BfR-BA-01029]
MSKKKKSRVLVAGICISTLLSPVAFEASKGYAASLEEVKGGKLEESKESRLEQRTFYVPGKGDVTEERDRLKVDWELAANEPTGIYAKPNEEMKIKIKGDESIKAFIGTHAYDEEDPKEFDLTPGENVISSPVGGILYFYNPNNQGDITAEVTNGGSHFPLFILGKHTKKDWDEMLKKYENPYAVELRGERSLITSSYDAVQDYMKNTDPTELLKLHDQIIRIENKISGLSEESVGVAKAPKHYVQFVENRYPEEGDWMNAYYYRTSYVKNAMKYVLDSKELKTDGWGPWHEVGHLHQQAPWEWEDLGEVTVNIYSLAVQTKFGHQTRLEEEERYKAAFAYLGQTDAQEKMDEFEKLVMFWQLHLAYGDQFYPKLHQMYRMLQNTEMPKSDEEKKQLFIYMTSKLAGQNLTPFFEKWGLTPNDDTRDKIEKLNLPKLEKEIWLSTDSNPIREKQTGLYEVPYGEPNDTKIQNVEIGTTYDEKKAKELVQNLGKGVKTTGVIMQDKPEVGEKTVKVEIMDEKGNKNFIPVVVNIGYGDSLVFKGLNYDTNIKSIVTLQHDQKKFSAMADSNPVHYYFKEDTYFEFSLLGQNGNEKKKATVKGVENAEEFAKSINGLEFEYGDVVKVYHAESDRFNWYQNNDFIGQGKAKVEKELLFKVTEKGFERMGAQQEVKALPQKVVIGTNSETLDAKNFVQVKDGEVIGFVEKPTTSKVGKQTVKVETKDRFGNKQVTEVPVEVVYGDSIAYVGYNNDIASIVTLKHDDKKFHATDMDSQIHKYFNKELYMGMTLYDGEGKEKKHVTAEGQETSKNFAKQVNGMQFEYGDVVKVFHAEPDRLKWYQNNNLTGQGEKKGAKELFFKVRETGFERMDMLQEVTAKPQQVVVGTAVEKLDPKAFVEVKDGEVIGFVEKPNTTKIGEQKVKVETKDRFGNKKVTEVPVEVIYGDSIMFFGTWHDGTNIKSIVTLNHEEKKFSTTDSEGPMHTSFKDEKYMAMAVYDKDGQEKKEITVKASENTKEFAAQFNGMAFEYGDIVKIYQKEFDRFKVYKKNEFIDAKYGVNEVFFKVTTQGFEQMGAQQEVKALPQKVVIGTNSETLDAKKFVEVKGGEVVGFVEKLDTAKIGEQKVKVETKDRFGNKKVTEVPVEVTYGDSIVYQGVSNVTRSIVTLNHDEKKLHATFTNDTIHYRFVNEQYIGLTIYDGNGKEKKHVTAEGQETSKNFAEQVNGTPFQYGDTIKVYHAESDRLSWYKTGELLGKGDAKKFKEISFKITPNGLEQVQ